MSDWPEYESHKVVRAAKITRVEKYSGGAAIFVDGGFGEQAFWPSVSGMADKAEVGGYAVLYPDGFKSISPAKAFEEGYTLKPVAGAQTKYIARPTWEQQAAADPRGRLFSDTVAARRAVDPAFREALDEENDLK